MHTDELTLSTGDTHQTRQAAAAIASLLRAGDVVSLSGELGAGKTCFVQGAARALGVTRRVTSPTFMLVRSYEEADPPVVHCDVYRLDRLHDVLDLGDEVMAEDVVTFIEWGDAVGALLPDDRLDVEVLLAGDGRGPDAADAGTTAGAGPTAGAGTAAGAGTTDAEAADAEAAGQAPRRMRVRGHGTWRQRLPELRTACSRWLDDDGDR